MYHVYILRCADGALYVGSSSNLQARIQAHNEGRAAAFTSRRRPVTLVYSEILPDLPAAIRRERQIKGWSRRKKEALIRRDVRLLHTLAKRRE